MKQLLFIAFFLIFGLGGFAQQNSIEKRNAPPAAPTQASLPKAATNHPTIISPAPKKHYPKKKIQESRKTPGDKRTL